MARRGRAVQRGTRPAGDRRVKRGETERAAWRLAELFLAELLSICATEGKERARAALIQRLKAAGFMEEE